MLALHIAAGWTALAWTAAPLIGRRLADTHRADGQR